MDANKHKYSISAMCKVLKISRSTYYYESQAQPNSEAELEEIVAEEFYHSRKNYGTRKLKKMLQQRGIRLSRKKISRLMKRRHLVSNYTKAAYKPFKSQVNEKPIGNKLNRQFRTEAPLEAVVTDLTYVRVGNRWHYVCLILDLFNREIIGYTAGAYKNAELVKQAIYRIPYSLADVKIFHTDRGSEFDNQAIDEIVEAFKMTRSLSHKGCPYDNAVAESTYKSFKTEFVKQAKFETLKQLEVELYDYVHWWNHLRIHGTLGYETPVSYRQKKLAKRTIDKEQKWDSQRKEARMI